MTSMDSDHSESSSIEKAIEKALKKLSQDFDEESANLLSQIIRINLERGRVTTFLIRAEQVTPNDYVEQVVDRYNRLNAFVRKVQVEKDEEIWGKLLEKLQRWAYNFLLKRNFNPGKETFRLATGYANETAMELMNAHFPYDVEFEPWVYVLLQNVCHRQIEKARRSSKVPNEKVVSLDELLESIPDALKNHEKHNTELRQKLLDGIDTLSSESRKQIIRYYYFDRLSFNEIAVKMGRNINAIYKLHFDALDNLRKVLLERGDINE